MNNKLPYIVIQARLASTRLPEKIILDFYEGKGILEILLERIKQVIPQSNIVVATSTENVNDSIDKISKKAGVHFFEGSENNVLKRFIDATDKFEIEKVIRICSDNPFLDIHELKRIYDFASTCSDEIEYASFWVNEKPSILTHYGLWTEYVSTKALKKVCSTTKDPLYLEHVTNYIHTNRDQFNIHWLNPSINLIDSVRLTTDTKNDFENQKVIFKEVISNIGSDFSTNDVFNYLKENPEIVTIMHNEIINNGK